MRHAIKPVGSILETDADGFIVKTASADKIQSRWWPAVNVVVEAYKQNLGDNLHSVYLRGSVAKGEAIDGISDIDTIAVVKVPASSVSRDWVDNFEKQFSVKYPFINGVEIVFDSLASLSKGTKILVKTQTVCLYGSDLAKELPPIKPGTDSAMHAPFLNKQISNTVDFLVTTEDGKTIKRKCAWIMKRIVRTGCELVIERSNKYTRDLYPCYELFSEYYPEKQADMYRALELAVNPSSDIDEIKKVLKSFDEWMSTEIAKSNNSKF